MNGLVNYSRPFHIHPLWAWWRGSSHSRSLRSGTSCGGDVREREAGVALSRVEASRGCLKVCWRRVLGISPLCPLDISPKYDDGAVEFGGEQGIEIFYEHRKHDYNFDFKSNRPSPISDCSLPKFDVFVVAFGEG